jgi:hypothetical protein
MPKNGVCKVKKQDVLNQLDKYADGDVAQSHLTDKQYMEIISLANRAVTGNYSELSRFEQGKMIIALYEKLDKKNVTLPRDNARKLEDNLLANYDKAIAKGLAIWKMSLVTEPTEDEITAKEAQLDADYRKNLATKAEQARKRNEFGQSM